MNPSGILTLIIGCLLLCSCQGSAAADALFVRHPDDASARVEYFLARPSGRAPWPTVVLLHGHQEWPKPGGMVFVEWGVLKQLAARGYLAVAVSQPGYGQSTGPADFAGTLTRHAIAGVLAKLRADGLVLPGKLLLEGVSRGAIAAGLVAAEDPEVTGLVLISGVFDMPAYVAGAGSSPVRNSIVVAMLAESGGSDEALLARSVLHQAGRIRAATLILNGAEDDRTDPGQAHALAREITRNGGHARAITYPGVGHEIPVEIRNRDIDPFIEDVLGAPGR